MEVKRCSICGQEHPVDMFYTDNSKVSGMDTRCRNCRKLYQERTTNPESYYQKLKNAVQQLQYLKQTRNLTVEMYGRRAYGHKRDLCNFTCVHCGKEFHRKSVFGVAMRNGLCVDCFGSESVDPALKKKRRCSITEHTVKTKTEEVVNEEPIRVQAKKKIEQEPISYKELPNIGKDTFYMYDPNTKTATPIRVVYVPVESGCRCHHHKEHKKGIWQKIKSIFQK